MIIQTLKLPAPESGATMLRALAIGYAKMGRKTLLVLPSQSAWVAFENKFGLDRDYDVMSAKQALMAWKRGAFSEFDAILVDEIAEAHTSEGNLWDILIHANGRSDTVLVGSDTQV
ncbi:hypothetical protein [Vibrio alginolyticus]|uniref:hypothetical protein n=1 Tax=Vibrio alginolyticus TaxID=663 RepID=UPI00168D657C|nr:hypothetical protein [Vibrio alginolyticus]